MVLRSIVLVPIAAGMLFLGACAPKRPISPFMQEQSVFQEGHKKEKKDTPTKALAEMSVFMKTDAYTTPPRILLGENVYEKVLKRLAKADESDPGIRYARGVALFYLHRYEEALEKLTSVAGSAFDKEAGVYATTAKKFAEVPPARIVKVSGPQDLQTTVSNLNVEREQWVKLSTDDSFPLNVRSPAREETERIDEMVFGFVAQYVPDKTEEAVTFLIDGHKESKNALRHKLTAVYLLMWRLEVLTAQHSEDNAELVAKTAEQLESILQEVADEDGTVEKLEAKRLLEVIKIRFGDNSGDTEDKQDKKGETDHENK